MYRVLIVDDELGIREGLTALLDWASLGFQVVDTAANAIEAHYKYKLYSPDLMIIDIRMPGQSGLELIRELREVDSELSIMILSGYADFSYAKSAMAYGIHHYLLKPVDEEELQQSLLQLSAKLDARALDRQKNAVVKGWSREMLVQTLLLEKDPEAIPASQKFFTEAGISGDSYQIVLIRLLLLDQTDNGPSTAVKAELSTSFEKQEWGTVFSIDSYLGVLIRFSFQMELERKAMVQEIRETVTTHGLDCMIAVGDRANSLKRVPSSYQTALTRMRDYFFYEDTGTIGPDSKRFRLEAQVGTEELERKLDTLVERLYFAMDTGSKEVYPRLIQEAGKLMISAHYSEMAVKSRFVRIMTYLLNKLSSQYPESEPSPTRMDEQIQHIYRHTSLFSLQRYLVSLLEQYSNRMVRDQFDVLMKRMVDLIHRRYSENLKLETLADVFAYSSAYLGKLFKTNMGLSFNSYLDQVRIEKAKELLDQGYKIHQAAKEVGFQDVDYFRDKFKKVEGVSPSDYRRNNPNS
ncbi:response regulator transcription factor [Gorillibacterium sp. CAU 1737]|uniref:response regulator transcription factor n=1 Tax=Gorillibacterium sp. CAU 1737 TaxID=3140362 RepID=UPI00326198A5